MYHTRIAPSPMGLFHLGTARTAYFNWLAARASGGTFTLRIDDTDVNRSDPKYTQVVLDAMDWLGLDYSTYIKQSDRTDIYQEVADWFLSKGLAERVDTSILFWPKSIHIPDAWYDEISKTIPISGNDRDLMMKCSICLIKANGTPTYHFASVVDDIRLGINYVIRGVDHVTNTSRQIAIYNAMNEPLPKYAHVGLLYQGGKKLSKRDNVASVMWYKEQGYEPEAMLNFMGRMGWSPTEDNKDKTLLPRNRMIELFFTGGHMRNSAANIDIAKLDFYNKKYKAMKA